MPFPIPREPSNLRIEPCLLHLQADSLQLNHLESPRFLLELRIFKQSGGLQLLVRKTSLVTGRKVKEVMRLDFRKTSQRVGQSFRLAILATPSVLMGKPGKDRTPWKHMAGCLYPAQTQETDCCSVAQSCPTLRPHGLQPARIPSPSLSPRACSNSRPLSE